LTHDCIRSCHVPLLRKDENSRVRTARPYRLRRALSAIDLVIENQTQKAFMSNTSLDEQIANALVDNAVNDGFLISVNGGEERSSAPSRPSRNVAEIIKAMFRSNMDKLTLNVGERRVGMITLMYGNGNKGLDVIGDHTNIPHINRLVENTKKEFEL
jgi:hypothetical protein